uniref:P2X purinoreceptor 7 intracellular domain-containing protein n=1 Tax=Leptobrachium leishanense TaxID=445787 RepID=A0A8C5QLR2_9ANUR
MINQPTVYLDPLLTDPRCDPREVQQAAVEEEERLSNTDWCICGKCVQMPTTEESVCCHEFQNIKEKFGEDTKCICEDPYVQESLVDREITIQLYRYGMSFLRKRFRSVAQMKESDFRKTAYRAFTMWVYGYLGPRRRRPIPACVVKHIREAFPSPDNTYMGFIYANSDGNAVDFY